MGMDDVHLGLSTFSNFGPGIFFWRWGLGGGAILI